MFVWISVATYFLTVHGVCSSRAESMVRGKEANHEEVCGKCNEGLHRENLSAHKCKKYLFVCTF